MLIYLSLREKRREMLARGRRDANEKEVVWVGPRMGDTAEGSRPREVLGGCKTKGLSRRTQ